MNENLEKNIPEEETQTQVNEDAKAAEETPAEVAEEASEEIAQEEAQVDHNSEKVPLEAITAPSENRPANLLRSAITAVIVLAIFAAVYFLYTVFNSEEKTQPQPSKPKTEMSVSEGVEKNQEDPMTAEETAEAPENASGNTPENAPAENSSQSNIQIATDDEEVSPEYADATKKITAEARKKYGEDVMVLPEYNSELKTVKIKGKEHKCYMAAAVKVMEGSTEIIHAAFEPETNKIWFDDTDKWEVLD